MTADQPLHRPAGPDRVITGGSCLIDGARAVIAMLGNLAPSLTVENRLQLRWESFAFDGVGLIAEALAAPLTPGLAFVHHTSMALLAPDVPLQGRPFDLSADFPALRPR